MAENPHRGSYIDSKEDCSKKCCHLLNLCHQDCQDMNMLQKAKLEAENSYFQFMDASEKYTQVTMYTYSLTTGITVLTRDCKYKPLPLDNYVACIAL